jgi:hypothetical protein
MRAWGWRLAVAGGIFAGMMERRRRLFRRLNYWLDLLYGRRMSPGTPNQLARRPVSVLVRVLVQ